MIEVSRLSKRYGSVLAVDSLSFAVRSGMVTGFLGPNGSGKSTTMRMILGLDAPDAGQALIGGRRYRDFRWPSRECGALLETKAFHPGRSASDHLAALAASNAIPRSRVDEVLGIVGLHTAGRRRAGTFSLGMAQRRADGTVQPLTVMDLEELEGCQALLQHKGRTLPELLGSLAGIALPRRRLPQLPGPQDRRPRTRQANRRATHPGRIVRSHPAAARPPGRLDTTGADSAVADRSCRPARLC